MNGNVRIMLAALGVAVAMASGCANNEVVKKEEPVAQQTVAPKHEPPKPTATQAKTAIPVPNNEQMKPFEATGGKTSENVASFESIYFDFDKSDLSQTDRNVLSKNAETMIKVKPDVKVKIEGNCDERGSAEYNLALGERRAKSALQYLITLGVPAERLAVISYGKEHPATPGHDEAAWAKNRRDDFVIQR